MKVIETLEKDKQALSFEFFPPKTKEQEEKLFEVIAELKKLNPDYVAVTCGALGTTQEKTFFWVDQFKNKLNMEPVAHLTCVGDGKEGIFGKLREFEGNGIENILALRGDPPTGQEKITPPMDGFRHASELVAFIKKNKPNFCIGVAGYPEKHPEAKSLKQDIEHLKRKVDAGADYIVTQLFFDNNSYFNFVEACHKAGIKGPIVPGIMPITNYKLLKKMTQICGASIPQLLLSKLEKHKHDPKSIKEIGVEQAVKQCAELKKGKVPGLHFFVMNQAGPITEILKHL